MKPTREFGSTGTSIVVLGAGGFVGRRVFSALAKQFPKVRALTRAEFDINDHASFGQHDFTEATIVDCIAQIDGDADTLLQNNYESLRRFLDALCTRMLPARYVYLSTTAANGPYAENPYVRSKQLAEAYLLETLPMSKIVRLSFPFGQGEKSNRLLSRIIHNIRDDNPLKIDDVTLNLTPIEFFADHIAEVVFSSQRIINFTDGRTYKLQEIVEHLYRLMGKAPDYVLNRDRKTDLTVKNPTLFNNNRFIDDALAEMIHDLR